MGLSSINCQGVLSLSFKLICPQLRQCFSTWHFLPSKHFPPVEKDHHVFGKIQCWCWLKCLKHPSGVDEDTEWTQWIPRSVEMKVEETSTSFPIAQKFSRDLSCCASPRVLFRLVLCCFFLARNLLQLYFTCYSKYFDNNACFDFNDFNWRLKWDVKSIKWGFLLFALQLYSALPVGAVFFFEKTVIINVGRFRSSNLRWLCLSMKFTDSVYLGNR